MLVINKIDRRDARVGEIYEEVLASLLTWEPATTMGFPGCVHRCQGRFRDDRFGDSPLLHGFRRSFEF